MCEKLDWMSAHLSIFHVGIGLINFLFINYCPPIFEPRMPSIDCFTIGTWLNLKVKRKRLISQLRKKHSCLYFYCAKNLTEFESESKKANISVCQKSCCIAFLLYQSHIFSLLFPPFFCVASVRCQLFYYPPLSITITSGCCK